MKIGKYRLEVSYSLAWTKVLNLDDKIRKAVGKRNWASGGSCGERDMSFDFTSRKKMHEACRRLERALLPVTITTHMSTSD